MCRSQHSNSCTRLLICSKQISAARRCVQGNENREREADVRVELDKYFGTDVDFKFRFVEAFDRKRAKAQYFESHV